MPRPLLALALSLALALPAGAETVVPADPGQIALSFAPVVRAAAPAVVNIYATRVVAERQSPFAGDPFFDQFFGDFGEATPRLQNSLGSGVIVDGTGIVVSNYHVVEQATEIRVVLTDRREYAASVMLADQASDLAVLRVEGAAGLPALSLRDSDTVEVGDLVLAIGNPFGVGQTVSQGIISGLARSSFGVGDGRGYFIQTDAAINPGNSGGALVDVQGRLVGINTAILSRGGGSNGIGFAIPANLVAEVVRQAAEGEGSFRRPWIGAAGQPVDQALADTLGLPRPEGVALTELHPQSPLAAAGLAPGDVILSLDGAATNTPQEMLFRLASAGIGREVTLAVLRGGAGAEVRLTLAPPPDTPPRDLRAVTEEVWLNGATLSRVNPAVIAELDLPLSARGVAVAAAQGFAARVGLRSGDVILAVNGQAVESPGAAVDAAAAPTRRWQVDLLRGGERLALRFRL
jgi:Do/DeqQ family serine protease